MTDATRPPRDTRPEHLALTQLHRWYELYERELTPARIALQLEILDRDVLIETTRGTARGHGHYLAGVAALPGTDRNSHRVTGWSIDAVGPDAIAMSAETTYQRLQADGTLTSTALRYGARLRRTGDALPVFEEIRVSALGPASETAFVDAYPENRARSALHRWLAAIEELGGPVSAFDDLLSPDGFELEFSTSGSPITTADQLGAWLAGVAGQIRRSSHRAEHLVAHSIDERHIALAADLDWSGTDRAGRMMAGRTHHDWLLEDTGERFARVKRVRVTQIAPFVPTGGEG